MVSVSFDEAFAATIRIEGEYSDDPNDSGGKTKFGITENVARAHGYTGDMKDLPLPLAKQIAKKAYWDVLRLDEIQELSEPIARELFDTCYNMGTAVAGAFLQRALNSLNRGGKDYEDIGIDGHVGTKTIWAFQRYIRKRGSLGETVLLRALNAQQGVRYMEIGEHKTTQEDYLFGWFANRVA